MKHLLLTFIIFFLCAFNSRADIVHGTNQHNNFDSIRAYIDHVIFDKRVSDTSLMHVGEEYILYPFRRFVVEEGYTVEIDTVVTPITSFNDSTINIRIPFSFNTEYPYVISFSFNVIDPEGQIVEYAHPLLTRQRISCVNVQHKSDTLDANNIKAVIYANDIQFYNRDYMSPPPMPNDYLPQHYNYPKHSSQSTIFNMGTWIGGLDENDSLHISQVTFGSDGSCFYPGPYSQNNSQLVIDSTDVYNWCRTWKISTEQLVYHTNHYNDPDYIMPEAIANWPAHGNTNLGQREYIAPFSDIDGDGEYRPENGDFPKIKGDQMVFYTQNDIGNPDFNSLGVEIDYKSYAFANTQDAMLANSTFYQYIFHNQSNHNYHDVYIGLYVDMDLGFYGDDYVACDVQNGCMYTYNGKPVDGNGESYAYGATPPIQAAVILGGPFMDADQIDNPNENCNYSVTGVNFDNGIVDDERLGMTGFMYYYNYWGPSGDPQEPSDYYNYLQGLWRDSTQMQYGGDAYQTNIVGPATKFMFPGDSDLNNWSTNCNIPNDGYNQNGKYWTEEQEGNPPGDRRGLISVGPFSFESKSVDTLDFALVTIPFDTDIPTTLASLRSVNSTLKTSYKTNPSHFGDNTVGIVTYKTNKHLLQAYPNPANGDYVYVQMPNIEIVSSYSIYATSGQLVKKQSLIGTQHNLCKINIANLNKGLYIISLTTKKGNVYQAKFIK